jgi:hypothetical protein
MAITAPPTPGPASSGGSVPVQPADAKAAKQSGGGKDRPGFDLGGAEDRSVGAEGDSSPPGSNVIPGGPKTPVPPGSAGSDTGRATGMNEGDRRSLGGTAGGSRPGEANQATAGAVRPPQSTSADQTFSQGNPDDAS